MASSTEPARIWQTVRRALDRVRAGGETPGLLSRAPLQKLTLLDGVLRSVSARAGGLSARRDGLLAHGSRRWAAIRRRSAAPVVREPFATVVVEADDSVATICGKIDATRLNRVAVSVPRGNAELSRAIGMRLLMRHAELSGKDVVIVSARQAIRQRARAEGQSYARSERRIRFPGEARPALNLGGLDLGIPDRAVLLPCALLALLLLLGYAGLFWFLPVGTLTLYPLATPLSVDQPLTVDGQATHLNRAGFVVPGVRRQLTVTRTIVIPATGPAVDGHPEAAHSVAEADLASAQAIAPAAIRQQAIDDFNTRCGRSEMFFPETARVQVLSVEPEQHAGDAADFIQVIYRGSVDGLSARRGDLLQLFTGLLQQKLSQDRQLIDTSIALSAVKAGPFDADGDKLPVEMTAQANSMAALQTTRFRNALKGKSRRDALAYADREVAASRPASLHLAPGWVPWLPRIASHIHLAFRSG